MDASGLGKSAGEGLRIRESTAKIAAISVACGATGRPTPGATWRS